jgi:cell shape-determining protein MreC
LFSTRLVPASVLSRSAAIEVGRLLATIDRGSADDAASSQWVVHGESVTLDRGTEDLVAADCPVIAGRSVFGKVESAGHWTSSVRHVSDIGFRTHARLVRPSPAGPVNGAEGMLVGAGEGSCRLELIAATDPVQVGDEVWTAEAIPGIEAELYLGRVTRAELAPTDAHWTIEVTPDIGPKDAERVEIVRIELNPGRQQSKAGPEGISPLMAGTPQEANQ